MKKEIRKYLEDNSFTSPGKMSIIFYSLFVITNRVETVYNNSIEDLSLKQLMLLIIIAISEGETYTSYGEIMGSSRQNIKTLALNLEKKGYVKIEESQVDKRASSIVLTEKAKEHFQKRDDYYSKQIINLFNYFSQEEINQLYEYIGKLFKGVEKMEEE